MKNQFIPHELSLELKKLGFDEPCLGYYNCDWDFVFVQGKTQYMTCEIPAPT
jgi:hypothetical protein